MMDYLKKNSLNAVFVDEVLTAIRVVGEEKIKLANVSLGTMFEKNIEEKNWRLSAGTDLFAEFVRYRMGEQIRSYASGSLFFVATGNDKSWVDGISRTYFPVGITSLRTKKISEEKGMPLAPNNGLKNVIGVGSVNPNRGTFTPFSNILYDAFTPQVFADGEEVMSTIPLRENGEVAKVASKFFKKYNEASEKLRKRLKGLVSGENNFAVAKAFINLIHQGGLVSDIEDIWQQILVSSNPVMRGKKSGTSMASPEAAKRAAHYILEKAIRLKIPADQIYDHPEFSAEKLQPEIYELAKDISVSPDLTIQTLTEEKKDWKATPAVKNAKAQISGFLKSSGKSCSKILGQ
jgi:hypothetical protein